MKFLLLTITIVFLIGAQFLSAQDNQLDSMKFDQPVEPMEESSPYFVVGGGYFGTLLKQNFTEINNFINKNNLGFDNNFDGWVYLHGGQGFVSALLGNFRLGFVSMSGSKTLNKIIDTLGTNRSFVDNISFIGLSLDYAFVLHKRWAILPGIGFGFGSIKLESYQSAPNNDWSTKEDANFNYYKVYSSNNIYFQPNLNIEWAPSPITMIRVGIGYPLTYWYDWKFNNNGSLSGVPTGLKSDGMTIQFGLLLGLFNY